MAKAPRNRLPKATSPPNGPPPPFTPAPSALDPLLATLDEKQVYIFHIDSHPADLKRRIFTVPVILNLTIALLLAWRAWAIAPTYLDIVLGLLGGPKDGTTSVGDGSKMSREVLWAIAKRATMFLVDFFLVRFIGPWPVTFFLEWPANPVSWRWAVGFREKEVVVRVSRGWGAAELLPPPAEGKQGDENPFFKTRILPAVEEQYVKNKTGYLMMGASWDLDFAAMTRATKLVDEGVLKVKALEKSVVVWIKDASGEGEWIIWEVHRLDESEPVGAEAGPEEVTARKRIIEFKDRLAAMGKEDLFFRWIELVQYETSQPGGFTPQRQIDTANKVRELFDAHEVDFEEFAELAGVNAMPGMEGEGI